MKYIIIPTFYTPDPDDEVFPIDLDNPGQDDERDIEVLYPNLTQEEIDAILDEE